MKGKRRKIFKVLNPQNGSFKYELIGKKFGLLTVISEFGKDKYLNRVWLCQCDCGNTCKVITTYLNNGKVTSCKCNQYKKGDGVHNYSGYKDITGTKWNSIVNNAKTRELELSITKEFVWELFLKQNKKCAISGLEIDYKLGTASVDRIDNNKGYTEDNIWIVHKDINLMRNKFELNYFISMCKLISSNN